MQITGPDSGIPVVEAEGIAEVVAPAAVGVVVGANGHVAAIVPEPAVLEYISATPVNPFAVQGEVVVGAVRPGRRHPLPGARLGLRLHHRQPQQGAGRRQHPRAIVYIHRV